MVAAWRAVLDFACILDRRPEQPDQAEDADREQQYGHEHLDERGTAIGMARHLVCGGHRHALGSVLATAGSHSLVMPPAVTCSRSG